MFLIVTGGSGSGKSAYAESRIMELPIENRIYIATMYPFDEESHKRIARHRAMRATKHFQTVERYVDMKHVELPENAIVLLECMSNLTANEMYQENGAGENTVEAVLEGIKKLKEKCRDLIVVTNEVFSDGIDYDPETMRYLSYLGGINAGIAKMADEVVEVVYGIPVWHKGTHEYE